MDYKFEEWNGFDRGTWSKEINVRSFIRHNHTPYDGNEDFLVGPTESTLALWDQVLELTKQEREAGGVLDMDTDVISTNTSHAPGYLDKEKEVIVGNVLEIYRHGNYRKYGKKGKKYPPHHLVPSTHVCVVYLARRIEVFFSEYPFLFGLGSKIFRNKVRNRLKSRAFFTGVGTLGIILLILFT